MNSGGGGGSMRLPRYEKDAIRTPSVFRILAICSFRTEISHILLVPFEPPTLGQLGMDTLAQFQRLPVLINDVFISQLLK